MAKPNLAEPQARPTTATTSSPTRTPPMANPGQLARRTIKSRNRPSPQASRPSSMPARFTTQRPSSPLSRPVRQQPRRPPPVARPWPREGRRDLCPAHATTCSPTLIRRVSIAARGPKCGHTRKGVPKRAPLLRAKGLTSSAMHSTSVRNSGRPCPPTSMAPSSIPRCQAST